MLNEAKVIEFKEAQEFRVIDLNTADYCFEKLYELNLQIKEKQEFAQAKIDKTNMWLTDEVGKIEANKAYFEGLLTEYAVEQRRLNSKFRLSTPTGRLSFRKQAPKWNYDDAALLSSLKNSKLDNLIRIKEEVNKTELKKVAAVKDGRVLIDGEFIEGIEVLEQDEAIKIEVAE